MNKRHWFMGLATVLALLCTLPIFAQSEADFEVDLTADGEGVLIRKYVGKVLQVRIPATIQGMPVKEIGNNAFTQLEGTFAVVGTVRNTNRVGQSGVEGLGITSVVIPEGVTKIGSNAFGTIINDFSQHYHSQHGNGHRN